jgi:hypothetical protein
MQVFLDTNILPPTADLWGSHPLSCWLQVHTFLSISTFLTLSKIIHDCC